MPLTLSRRKKGEAAPTLPVPAGGKGGLFPRGLEADINEYLLGGKEGKEKKRGF